MIFLAAGNSTRFGSNKLLYQLNGKCMYRYGLEVMDVLQRENLIDSAIIVTQYPEIWQDIEQHFPKMQSVRNPHPELGISGSIRLGVEKLTDMRKKCGKVQSPQEVWEHNKKKCGCMFAVADQPYLTALSLKKMILHWENSDQGIMVSSHGEHMGNPVIFSAEYYEELLGLTGDVGGKKIVKKHLDDVQMFEMPESELKDLDLLTEIHE